MERLRKEFVYHQSAYNMKLSDDFKRDQLTELPCLCVLDLFGRVLPGDGPSCKITHDQSVSGAVEAYSK